MNTRNKIWFHLDFSLPTRSIVKRENPYKQVLPQSQQVTTIPNMSHDLQVKGRKKNANKDGGRCREVHVVKEN